MARHTAASTTRHERDQGSDETPDGTPGKASLEELTACYTPNQREAYLKGLRILAQVAVRAHMRRQTAASEAPQDDSGEAS